MPVYGDEVSIRCERGSRKTSVLWEISQNLVFLWRQFPQMRKNRKLKLIIDNSKEQNVCFGELERNLQTFGFTCPVTQRLLLEFGGEDEQGLDR